MDIGTGANLIYPILASRHFNWQCTASEVDLDSLKNAQEIIANNSNLKDIELRHQKFKNSILEHIIQPTDVFDVVVCNPPFYKTRTDAELLMHHFDIGRVGPFFTAWKTRAKASATASAASWPLPVTARATRQAADACRR